MRRSRATARKKRSAAVAVGLTAGAGFRWYRHPASHHLRAAGQAQQGASGFFSGIIREPLSGQEAVLPVPETVRHWFCFASRSDGFLLHAAGLNTEPAGRGGAICRCPDFSYVAEQIESLRRVAGDKPARLIRREAGSDDHANRRGLAEELRCEAARDRSASPRQELRRHHSLSHRGRAVVAKNSSPRRGLRVRFIGGRLSKMRFP